jgi:ribonuclease Z
MYIKFLGIWSSNIIKGQRNVSFVLDDKIAFDFGPHSLESLLEMGIDPLKIKFLLITHMHLDHYSGIAELLWYRSIHNAKTPLMVFGPKGIKNNTARLMEDLKTPRLWSKQVYNNVKYIEDKSNSFVQVFPAHHLIPDNGYRVEYKGKTIFYSGDTAYSKNVVKGAAGVDILFHEMTYTDKDKEAADLWRHSTYSSTLKVFEESHAKKLVPVHLTVASALAVKKLSITDKRVIFPGKTIKL